MTVPPLARWAPTPRFAVDLDAWLHRQRRRIDPDLIRTLLLKIAEAVPSELHEHVKISVVSDGVSVTTGNYWLVKLANREVIIAGPVQGLAEHVFMTAPDWRLYSFAYAEARSLLADAELWGGLREAAIGLTASRQGGFATPPGAPHKLPLSAIVTVGPARGSEH